MVPQYLTFFYDPKGQKLPPSLVDVIGTTKPGTFNAFSICYADEGGLFTIGGYNTSYHDKTDIIKYVPFFSDNGQYRVHVNSIQVSILLFKNTNY